MSPTNVAEKKQTRIEWVDIAKCFCIILMIIGHTVELDSFVRKIVFSFHMPLFIILSGFTFNTNIKAEDVMKKTLQDVKRLIVPTVITIVFSILFQIMALETFSGVDVVNIVSAHAKALFWASGFSYDVPILGALWFLISLFWARLIVRIVLIMFSFESSMIVLCTMSLVGIFYAGNHSLPQNFDVTLALLFFFVVGILWRKYYDIVNKYALFFFILSMTILTYLLSKGVFIELASRSYPLGIISFIEGVCGTFICCKFAEAIAELRVFNKAFVFIGQNTLLILCIHHLDNYFSGIWYTGNMLTTCAIRMVFNFAVFYAISLGSMLLKKRKSICKCV